MRNQFYYHRNLPHWFPRDANIFVTWRLFGSLPQSCLQKLEAYRTELDRASRPQDQDSLDWELRKRKRVFAMFDSMLDNASTGPTWLKIPEIANVVQEAIIYKYSAHRNGQEFDRAVAYIENNPVKAGLISRPEEWEWSSAKERIRRGWDNFRVLS